MRSMTGFGRGRAAGARGGWEAEARSENHRGLRLAVSLPGGPEPGLEERLWALLRGQLERGAVRLALHRLPAPAGGAELVDEERLGAWRRELERLGREQKLAGKADLALLLGLPGVVRAAEAVGRGEEEQALQAAAAAFAELAAARAREGEALRRVLEREAEAIAAHLARAQALLAPMLAAERRRLEERLAALGAAGLPEAAREGLAREAALLAARSDVTEELDRLGHHLQRLREALAGEGPVGRRLDFLAQELHREATTVGAKSSSSELDETVLELKLAIERVREQAGNVE